MDERTISCLRESEIDTIEIALKKRMEDLLSEGNIDEAEIIEDTIKSLDDIDVCKFSAEVHTSRMEWLRGLAGE